jgi:outer membrane protein assembly factor BamA
MQKKSVLFLSGLLALIFPSALPAQQLLKPQVIRFDGLQQYSPDELLAFSGIKKGQTYTADYLQQSAQKLMDSGVFTKVLYKFDGIDLVYSVVENPDMYTAVNENLPLPADFAPTLRQKVPLFHGKVPSEGALLENVKSALETLLADEGIAAKVSAIPAGIPNQKATAIKFRLDSPYVRIGDVQFTGVSDALKATMEKTANGIKAPYDFSNSPGVIEDAIRTAYINLGFAAVKVHAVQSGNPVATDVIRVPFSVAVEEGHQYKLGKVQFTSAIPFPFDDVTKNISREKITPEATYINFVRAALASRFRSRGYLDVKTSVSPQLDDAAGLVNYTIDAVPGPQYHLGLIRFENVSDTLRSLLMRAWQMMPGDPFDESYVSTFLFNAQKSDPVLARSLVGVRASYTVRADPTTHDVNVILKLERAQPAN